MMKAFWFLFLAFVCCFVSTAVAQRMPPRLPCSQIATPGFLLFGLETPPGWQCTVSSDSKNPSRFPVLWIKGQQEILSSMDSMDDWKSDSRKYGKSVPGFGMNYPQAVIRDYLEFFLADSNKLKNNPYLSENARLFAGNPKAILFSKNNDFVVVYHNNGATKRKGKEVSWQNAYIFKKSDSKNLLNVSCFGCSPDDFFSLIINPLIQR
jgi:hypothetical protein